MPTPELHLTLAAAVAAVSTPAEAGLVITEVDLDLPVEVVAGTRDGQLVIGGTAPHSRWVAGILPEVHRVNLRIGLLEGPSPAAGRHRAD